MLPSLSSPLSFQPPVPPVVSPPADTIASSPTAVSHPPGPRLPGFYPAAPPIHSAHVSPLFWHFPSSSSNNVAVPGQLQGHAAATPSPSWSTSQPSMASEWGSLPPSPGVTFPVSPGGGAPVRSTSPSPLTSPYAGIAASGTPVYVSHYHNGVPVSHPSPHQLRPVPDTAPIDIFPVVTPMAMQQARVAGTRATINRPASATHVNANVSNVDYDFFGQLRQVSPTQQPVRPVSAMVTSSTTFSAARGTPAASRVGAATSSAWPFAVKAREREAVGGGFTLSRTPARPASANVRAPGVLLSPPLAASSPTGSQWHDGMRAALVTGSALHLRPSQLATLSHSASKASLGTRTLPQSWHCTAECRD
jgi:hypothetical protein